MQNNGTLTESRVFKSSRNVVFGLINQIITIFIQFLVRTIFIKTLAEQYLGLNGLFSNILSVLSLAELGLGTAIVCNMYGPLARGEEEKVLLYFKAYKKIYSIIGIIIASIGLCILPFVNYLVKDSSDIPYLKLFFGIYLADTVSSYFFAHYKSLFSADQKEYINTIVRTLFLIIQTVLQIVFLITTHNLIVFLLIKIACNLLTGFVISISARKKYPYITEKKQLFNDSYGVLTVRIGLTVLNSTDNILISTIFGSIITGHYSNYSLIIGAISTATGLIFASVESSIGNYCAQNDASKSKDLFRNIHYVYFCIYGFCSMCLVSLLLPFIQTWLGNNFLLFNNDKTMMYLVVFVIVFNFYLSCYRQANLSFITVNHMLKKTTIKNIIEPILNLGISIVLAKTIGLIGVFIGTAASLLLTSFWFEPFVLYKDYFKAHPSAYFLYILDAFLKIALICVGSFACIVVSFLIYNGTIWSLILCFASVILISAIFVTIPFLKTKPFLYLFNNVKKLVFGLLKRKEKINESI